MIKVENPRDGGDMARGVGPYFFEPGDSHFFMFNRNKRSVTLDLNIDEGKVLFHQLVATATLWSAIYAVMCLRSWASPTHR